MAPGYFFIRHWHSHNGLYGPRNPTRFAYSSLRYYLALASFDFRSTAQIQFDTIIGNNSNYCMVTVENTLKRRIAQQVIYPNCYECLIEVENWYKIEKIVGCGMVFHTEIENYDLNHRCRR
jgi:hypothetical protein